MQIQIKNPNNLPMVDYRTVKPLQGNLKDLTKKNYEKLENVLTKRGFELPFIIWQGDEKWLLDGHQRQRVMIAEDMNDNGSYEVPYVIVQAENEKEAKAKLLEITSQYGTITQEGFDEYLALAELPEAETLELVNFDALQFGKDEDTEVEEDEPPEADESEPPKSKLGDLYKLGNHRLMCGDSTVKEDVEKLMDGAKADMVFTDPPYGVGYDGGAKKRELLIADNVGTDIYRDALPNLQVAASDHAALYLWYADAHVAAAAAAAAGYVVTAQIIWTKNNAQFVSTAHYHGKHEPCFYAHRKGKSNQWFGGKNEVTVWEVDRSNKNEFHPTQKPIALAARAMGNSSKIDDIVLDLFGGSGSTLIACEQLKRKCYMMELDPRYVDVIRKRYWKFTHDNSEEGWEQGTAG